MRKVILLTEGTSSYARGLLHGVSEYSRHYGPWTFFRESITPFYRQSNQTKALSRIKNWGGEGVIARVSEPNILQKIVDLGLPLITTDDNIEFPGIPRIVSDYEETGKLAAQHLLNRGFSQFAFCGFDNLLWSRLRYKSFRNEIKKDGYDSFIFVSPRATKGHIWEKEQPKIIKWLKSLPKPIGVMASNDDRGQQIIECCRIAGIYVPEQVAVIGVDNDVLLCDLSNPRLSSVAIDTRRAGYLAAERLDKLMAKKKVKSGKIIARATHIETRQSTDTYAIDSPEVVEALHYITQNAKNPIQVDDVAKEVSLSRRILFDKFHKYLGRSVHQEIKRVRIEHIARMLIETDLTIYQIALAFHFTSIEHIARYFRQEKGMAPKEYRKRYGK